MPWDSLSVLWGGGLFILFNLQTISFCLCSFFSSFKEQCCFPHSLQLWDPRHVPAIGSPVEPEPGHHLPC